MIQIDILTEDDVRKDAAEGLITTERSMRDFVLDYDERPGRLSKDFYIIISQNRKKIKLVAGNSILSDANTLEWTYNDGD